jgi:hypothetical protein
MLRPLLLLAHLLSFDGVQEASELRGKITDSSGRPLSGARVTILTPQRGVVKTVDTATDGTFTVTSLEPGSYLVIARAQGLEEPQAAVDVAAHAPSSITLALAIAGVRETVSITASPGTALDVANATQAVNVISQADIEQRAPVVTAQAFSEETGVALQRTSPTVAGVFVRGLTGNKVNVFVDGVRYSNSAQRGGVNTFLDLIDQSYLEGIEGLRGPKAPSTAATRSAAASSSFPRSRRSGPATARGSADRWTCGRPPDIAAPPAPRPDRCRAPRSRYSGPLPRSPWAMSAPAAASTRTRR